MSNDRVGDVKVVRVIQPLVFGVEWGPLRRLRNLSIAGVVQSFEDVDLRCGASNI